MIQTVLNGFLKFLNANTRRELRLIRWATTRGAKVNKRSSRIDPARQSPPRCYWREPRRSRRPISRRTWSAPLRLRGLSSFRAGVATAADAAKSAASSLGGQKRKQVASVANPLVKHCVKLRLSAAYRRSCRRLLLVGLAPILYSAAPGPCHPTCPASLLFLNLCFCPLLQGGV